MSHSEPSPAASPSDAAGAGDPTAEAPQPVDAQNAGTDGAGSDGAAPNGAEQPGGAPSDGAGATSAQDPWWGSYDNSRYSDVHTGDPLTGPSSPSAQQIAPDAVRLRVSPEQVHQLSGELRGIQQRLQDTLRRSASEFEIGPLAQDPVSQSAAGPFRSNAATGVAVVENFMAQLENVLHNLGGSATSYDTSDEVNASTAARQQV